MKKLCLTTYLLLILNVAVGQLTEHASEKILTDKELGLKYLKKSRDFKIAGWSLLGVGLTLYTIGAQKITNDLFSQNHDGEALLISGAIILIGNFPCFLAGAKNKGRAEILLRKENIIMSNKSLRQTTFPSLGLVVKL